VSVLISPREVSGLPPGRSKEHDMHPLLRRAALGSLVLIAAASAAPAFAVPAFARKYGTSCQTCHSAFPKLTPFGEAFRRNGYRFPGVDSDYVKQEPVALGQEANKKNFPNSVWPGTLPSLAPLAVGFTGSANVYPDKKSSVPRQNNGTQASLDNLVGEGQLFIGAALSDTVTIFGELSFADGGASVEHAQVFLNDLVGPKHAINLAIGKGTPTLTSFGPHSSYAGGLAMPDAPTTGIYGLSNDPFVLGGNYAGVELNGVVAGSANYAAGWSSGANGFGGIFNSENLYFSGGYKLGGMRLDGEGSAGPADPMRPWAERAVTAYGFVYSSSERFPSPADATVAVKNSSLTVGGGVRGQLDSAELDLGYYQQAHRHGTADLGRVDTGVAYGELSYVLYPWLIPFFRTQRIELRPSGAPAVADLMFMPGVTFLVRPNVKLMVAGTFESANGFPRDAGGNPLAWQGGAGDTGAFVLAPGPGASAASSAQEFSALTFLFAWAL
jgi:hypothetical protein